MMMKKNILFLCTGNSCRSQMAEGLCREFKGNIFNAYSAGIKTHGLNPLAVKVMKEIGIDISHHYSKTPDDLEQQKVQFDYVITVCGNAHETCPIFQGNATIIHHGFDDPPLLAKTAQSDEEVLQHYRRVRDEIKEYIISLTSTLA
jgi:arsenate reductase